MNKKRWAATLLLAALSGCITSPKPPDARTPMRQTSQKHTEGQGLLFSLSPGQPENAANQTQQASVTPLSPAEIQKLLQRLPALKAPPTEHFALRPESLPPPRTAHTNEMPFPPKETAKVPDVAVPELKVTSYAPQGPIEMAPHLAVSFNQPMVPLTSLADLETKTLPVHITPQPEGKWRWLGTDTLMFVPTIRFPMATEYKVEIPAGATSANGKKLAAAQNFTFTTPALQLKETYPRGGGHDLHPLMFLGFDQDIDPQALLKLITLTTRGQAVPVRMATDLEIAAEPHIRALTEAHKEKGKRYLVIAPQQDLSPAKSYQVQLAAGAPSQEGPLKTQAPLSFDFSTYDPLKVTYHSETLPPGSALTVSFNNALDPAKFDPSQIKVSPELPGLHVTANGNTLFVRGRTKGRTTYTLTLPASLTDIHGQTLAKEENVTYKITQAYPMFSSQAQAFTVLDPAGDRQLTYNVLNYKTLRVRAWKVTPDDWQTFLKYLQTHQSNPKDLKAPGQSVLDKEIEVKAGVDEPSETRVDLTDLLPGGIGQLVVQVEPLNPILDDPSQKDRWGRPAYVGWVQSTHIGLDAMADRQTLVAWANDLATGQPLPEVSIKLKNAEGKTGPDGLARLNLSGTSDLLIARKGQEVAILPREFSYWYASGWTRGEPADTLQWYVADDRKLYRPGEKVSLKGWLRKQQYGPEGDLTASTAQTVNYTLTDSRGNEISKGKAPIGKLGGFSLEIELPKTVNLGSTNLTLSSDQGGAYTHSFQVEEFRRPEFEVSASSNPGSAVVGEHSTFTATAAYFAGGPLANSNVQWSVTASPTTYSPPHWDGYTFGTWTPWWNYRCWWLDERPSATTSQSLQTHTDASGKASVRADFQSVEPAQPMSVVAQATVQDVNRQSWTSSSTVLVHPCKYYVGLKSQRAFVEKGEQLELSAIVTDIDGKAVSGKHVTVNAYRLDWDDSGKTKHADQTSQDIVSAPEPVSFKVPTGEGGTYQVEVLVQDDNQTNRSEMTVWVAGGKQPPSLNVAQETLTLVPSKKEYTPTDTAEVLVQAPFSPAEIVVTKRRNGLAEVERMSLPTGSTTLKIPLKELYIPGLTVQVDAVGSKVRTDANGKELPGKPMSPAYASGTLNLNISNASRKLAVTAEPQSKSLEPGAQTAIDINLKDSEGHPVSGEVSLFVVDESVLALTGYDPADPLATFCNVRSGDVTDTHSRKFVLLNQAPPPEEIGGLQKSRSRSSLKGGMDEETFDAPSGGAAEKDMRDGAPMNRTEALAIAAPAAPSVAAKAQFAAQPSKKAVPAGTIIPSPAFKVRTNFTPLALYAPSVTTDAQGHAVVPFKLPDNLTRYRIVALAAAGTKQFGKGESSLTARQPLMIRPSAPRFLNFGDHFQLPVVVQNQTDKPMHIDLVCRAANAKIESPNGGRPGRGATSVGGYALDVKPNDRVEVRFPCAAAQPGTARFQFGASSGKNGDAAEISLPVWTPATTEAFATYGVIDQGAVKQPIQKPTGVVPDFGGLTVTTSSTALAELTDSFIYLYSYPFECSEQISSRMLAAAALKDVLQAFKAPGMPTKEALETAMNRDLERLRGQQNYDGGWDYWVREKPSIPYLTVHVAHTLVRCRAKGFKVNDSMYEQALRYVTDIEQHIPADYSESSKRCIRSYAVYVLDLAGKTDTAKARALVHGEHSVESLGWLLPTLAKDPGSQAEVAEIHRFLDNHVTQTAATAQFTTSGYSDQNYLTLYSDRRTDGILLESLIATRPDHPLIPKLVRGLLDHRSAGRWDNTQENCWVLLALDKYFQKYESVTPDFVARVWLGDKLAGQQAFKGRNKDENALQIPMGMLQNSVTLAKEGAGRLYYRMGLKYAPLNLKLPAADYGFTVQRNYEAVGDNRDVRRDADGIWHVKAGSEVKVTVTMRAPSRRFHVALVDPLPAGFEALNPALQGNGDRARTKGRHDGGWWSYYWFEHQNLRDERVEAFTQLMWEGVYSYTYIARATTPGNFVVPPAKAEEMYHPETFGRTASDRVKVE